MIFRLLYITTIGLLASLVLKNLHIGIDFYHFWVVGAARAGTERSLGSPHAEPQEYAAVLNAQADRIWLRYLTPAELRALGEHPEQVPRVLERLVARHGEAALGDIRESSRFLQINTRRRALDLTGTPLLYALCTFLPADYEQAYELWAWLSFAAFVVAAFVLLRATGRPWEEVLLWAAALALAMRPLNVDVRVGNMNALHLLVAAIPLAVAFGPLRRAAEDRARVGWGAFALAGAAFYVLVKPTFAFAGLALAGHVWVMLGRALFVRALVPAAGAALLMAAFPCVLFGAPLVWFDWLGYITQDSGKLAYGIEKSNLSTPLHLASWFPAVPMLVWSTLLAALVLGSFLAVVRTGAGRDFFEKLRSALTQILRDPFAAASMGLCVTLATSPLVWGHYLTAFTIPLVWYALWERELRGTAGAWVFGTLFLTAALLYLGFADLVLSVFEVVDQDGTMRSITAFAWIPLWIALLGWLRMRFVKGDAQLDGQLDSAVPIAASRT